MNNIDERTGKPKIILDIYGATGSWSKFYKEAGYTVRVINLPYYDARLYIPTGELIYGILLAPPCTEFSYAKNMHGKKCNRDILKGLATVDAGIRIVFVEKPVFWALENPRGYLQKYLGKPKFEFDPCDFGDPYRKRTQLWGNFNIPEKHPVEVNPEMRNFARLSTKFLPKLPEGYISFEDKRAARRAMTPQGFAKSFFEANR